MRTRPGICQRKRRFDSEAAALAVAQKARFALRPYRCALCRKWHLTSRTKGMKLPAFEVERRRQAGGAPCDQTRSQGPKSPRGDRAMLFRSRQPERNTR